MLLLNKHIVVTGAASGLGAAIARACLEEGAEVTSIDLKETGFCASRVADVSDEAQVQGAFADLERIDALVNSAGVVRRAAVADTSLEDFDMVLSINLRGAFLTSKYALPYLADRGGSILHLASVVGLTGMRRRSSYSASKGGLIALTRNMALDYADKGIRINCLCPGFIRTPLLENLLRDPGRMAQLTALHPLGRLGDASDVADAAIFLISEKAKWITGQAIAVDGGFSAGHAADV
jgi:NAD(P)-dependent dehydrogenase (short-subunit alcohol dehydrogenase family)